MKMLEKLFKQTVSLKRFTQAPLLVLQALEDRSEDSAIQIVKAGHPLYVLITQEHYFKYLELKEWVKEHVDGIEPKTTPCDEALMNEEELNKFMAIVNEEDAEPEVVAPTTPVYVNTLF